MINLTEEKEKIEDSDEEIHQDKSAKEEPTAEDLIEKKPNNLAWIFISLVLFLALITAIGTKGFTDFSIVDPSLSDKVTISPLGQVPMEEAKTLVENFIKEKLVPPGTDAQVTLIEDTEDMYKMTLIINNQTYYPYMNKQVTLLFATAIPINKTI